MTQPSSAITAVLSLLIAAPLIAQTDTTPRGPADAPAPTSQPGARIDVTTRHIPASAGVILRVREMGQGGPVLLLTGGPGFAGEQLFATASEIAKAHRAILPDQRATGDSTVEPFEPGQFSLDLAVADLETIRIAMAVERWTLVGHSWGGLLSMAYAARHPDRITRMALVCPAGIDATFWRTYQTNLVARLGPADRFAMSQMVPTDDTPEALGEFMRTLNRRMAPAMIENKDALGALRREMTEDRFNPRVSLALQPYILQYDFKPALATFEKPVLVIQGRQDPVGLETTQTILDTIPGARRTLIEGCGHWPFLETPDKLNELLGEFLAAD